MSTNPPNVRLPFVLKEHFSRDVPDEVQDALHAINHAIRYAFNGVTDLQSAIPVLKGQIEAIPKTSSTTTTAAGNVAGAVNDQTGKTAVSLQNADYGAAVIVNNAAGVAVNLNALVGKPFYAQIINQGSAAAILTPSSGLVNGAASFSLAPGASVHAYYNSTNFDWTVG